MCYKAVAVLFFHLTYQKGQTSETLQQNITTWFCAGLCDIKTRAQTNKMQNTYIVNGKYTLQIV